MLKANDFFTLSKDFHFKDSFSLNDAPWEWVAKIKDSLSNFTFEKLAIEIPSNLSIKGQVYIDPTVKLPPYGSIEGPCYIGKNTELRPGIYIRGNVIVGESCVLGNSCEFKNTLILDNAQIPHFSYIGDSIIGNKAHLGAGVICSNLRLDQKDIKTFDLERKSYDTKMRKLGAIVGDGVEVGCNAVLNPGSLLLAHSMVYPNTTFSGTLNSGEIAHSEQKLKITRFKSLN
ncbi:MAG: UDP-N-acetylglucosamine diphosphorylase [Coraliomargaritaceae bacterium]|jgi:NDP-sugar pyrophosphorylase family protein|tara:strand:- start:266 stop:955 length:690 start_codon:yes stop_codon:yes gene_type:complete